MLTPLLPGTRQVFQLQVVSSLTEKSYLLLLDMGQELRLLMRAVKLVTLNRTSFEFYTFDPQFRQYL